VVKFLALTIDSGPLTIAPPLTVIACLRAWW